MMNLMDGTDGIAAMEPFEGFIQRMVLMYTVMSFMQMEVFI